MLNEIERLKDKFPKDIKKLNNLYLKFKKYEALQIAIQNFAIKELVDKLNNEIQLLNERLLSSQPLTELEREKIIVKRDCYDTLLFRYFEPDKKIEKIKQYIKKKYE